MYKWKVTLSDGDPRHMDIVIEISEAENKAEAKRLIKQDTYYQMGRNIIKKVTKVCKVID